MPSATMTKIDHLTMVWLIDRILEVPCGHVADVYFENMEPAIEAVLRKSREWHLVASLDFAPNT